MVLNIILDSVDLNDVLPEMVVLNIRYLRVFVLLLGQVEEVISLHLFDDLYEPIIKRRG